MENNPLPVRVARPDYGPRPTARPHGRPPTLSASRAAVLELLKAQPEPTSIAALVASTGLHENTVRGHLHALTRGGLVRRHRADAAGRGRPAWLYVAAPERELTGPAPQYAGLAATLAAAIQRSSSSPRADAIAAGTTWGRELAGKPDPGRSGTQADARRQVIELLDELGFAPRPDRRNAVVKLTRCPLLEAAHRYPEVVCGVHLGIVRGALEVYGGDAERTDLIAFSEPGACRLDLMTGQQT